MRNFALIAAIFGIALLTGLIAYYGFGPVTAALATSRWATAFVTAARVVALVGAGVGWWVLLPDRVRGPYVFVLLRFVREAINSFFPLAVVGGDVIGARLLAQFGIATKLAVASVLVDIFVQVVCLIVFVLAGVGIVAGLVGNHAVTATAMVLLAIAVPAVTGFFLALNFGAFEPVVRWLTAFGEKRQWSAFGHMADLGGWLQQIWRNYRGLSESFVVHLATVFFGAIEVWIALKFMNHPVGVMEAVAIESLGQGSRSAAFVLPGGLGVQDGALVAVCAIFGVPAEVALAMALIKRVPDLVLGAPSLLGWQALEGRHYLVASK
ncbi:MAG TPA: lysylphosphatidylglycerol synthase domain-containing protein [Xanthobacteraceae bacterium]|nr:lysylphosphatidylglycerol synthase domain-containing protein [Xanthobacteraceae bacterium]